MRRSRFLRSAASLAVMGLGAGTAGYGALSALGPVTSAFADSQPYALYCPGTPVGNIGFTGVVTSGTISPATLSAGTQFHLQNFQTKVNLAAAIVSATQALGNSAVMGSATATVDATGATPASLSSGTISFSTPIPSPIPPSGVVLDLPATVSTVGPFTASGGPVSLALDSKASLSVSVTPGTPPLSLTCTAYPNNAVTAGLGAPNPTGSPTSPVIASTTASGSSTPTTAAPSTSSGGGGTTATTAAPATSPATPSTMASTGPGPQLWLLALIGLLLIGVGFFSFLVGPYGNGARRRALRFAGSSGIGVRGAHARHAQRKAGAFTRLLSRLSEPAPGLWLEAGSPALGAADRSVPTSAPVDLWIEGWDPETQH